MQHWGNHWPVDGKLDEMVNCIEMVNDGKLHVYKFSLTTEFFRNIFFESDFYLDVSF